MILEKSLLDETITSQATSDFEYLPENESDSNLELDETIADESTIAEPSRERCFLVYESSLFILLKYCPRCGNPAIRNEVNVRGSLFKVQIQCSQGCDFVWNSQPLIKSCKGVGNLEMTTAITFSGIPPRKFEKFAWLINLKYIHDSTFYRQRKHFVRPVIREVLQTLLFDI